MTQSQSCSRPEPARGVEPARSHPPRRRPLDEGPGPVLHVLAGDGDGGELAPRAGAGGGVCGGDDQVSVVDADREAQLPRLAVPELSVGLVLLGRSDDSVADVPVDDHAQTQVLAGAAGPLVQLVALVGVRERARAQGLVVHAREPRARARRGMGLNAIDNDAGGPLLSGAATWYSPISSSSSSQPIQILAVRPASGQSTGGSSIRVMDAVSWRACLPSLTLRESSRSRRRSVMSRPSISTFQAGISPTAAPWPTPRWAGSDQAA